MEHTSSITPHKTPYTAGGMVQPKGYTVLLKSKGFPGTKGRESDEESAERMRSEITDLDSHT